MSQNASAGFCTQTNCDGWPDFIDLDSIELEILMLENQTVNKSYSEQSSPFLYGPEKCPILVPLTVELLLQNRVTLSWPYQFLLEGLKGVKTTAHTQDSPKTWTPWKTLCFSLYNGDFDRNASLDGELAGSNKVQIFKLFRNVCMSWSADGCEKPHFCFVYSFAGGVALGQKYLTALLGGGNFCLSKGCALYLHFFHDCPTILKKSNKLSNSV